MTPEEREKALKAYASELAERLRHVTNTQYEMAMNLITDEPTEPEQKGTEK